MLLPPFFIFISFFDKFLEFCTFPMNVLRRTDGGSGGGDAAASLSSSSISSSGPNSIVQLFS